MQQSDRGPGVVCTFYSYKGGVGRSMALANVAALLSRYGRKVLIVDWDLEAPGLEKFFSKHLLGSRASTPGLLDLVGSYADGSPLDWRKCLLTAAVPQGERIALLHAGRDTPEYLERLRTLDWDDLFRERNFGRILDGLRDEWISEYEFVLIDSRTGITDVGGICSILMPEYLVCLFTTNEQSLKGVRDTMERARRAHADLPLDRRRLVVIPIPARDESNTEYRLAQEWRTTFARELGDFYKDWIPKDETADRVLDYLKIPYVAYWSFGEKLPVLEEETDNPKKLAFSYAVIARLINSRLNWNEVKQGRQAAEAEAAQQAETQLRSAEAARIREEALHRRSENERKEAEAQERRRQELSARVEQRYAELLHRQRYATGRWRMIATLLSALAVLPPVLLAAIYVSNRFAWTLTDYLGVLPAGSNAISTVAEKDPLLAVKMILVLIGSGLFAAAYLAWLKVRRSIASMQELEREYSLFNVRGGIYDSSGMIVAAQVFARRIEEIAAADARPTASPKPEPAVGASMPARPSSVLPPIEGPSSPTLGGATFPEPMKPPETSVIPAPSLAAAAPNRDGSISPEDTPADPTSGPIDVVLSYVPSSLTQAWLREFQPLFESWLAEYIGRAPVVIAPMPKWFDLPETSRQCAVAVVIVSRAYMKSDLGMTQLQWLIGNLGPSRIFPIVLDRNVEAPNELRASIYTDLSDFAFVGEGFSKNERYVDFQAMVREFANQVADTIEKVQPRIQAVA